MPNYKRTVRKLARWHSTEHAAKDLVIYSYDDPEEKVIRLLEVSRVFPGEQNEDVWSMDFGASPEVPFQSRVALASRKQWRAISRGDLTLPKGWEGAAPREVYHGGNTQ